MYDLSIYSPIAYVFFIVGGSLSILAYFRRNEIGWMIGTGIGIMLCSAVIVGGRYGTRTGTVVFVAGAITAMISTYLAERNRKGRRFLTGAR